MTAPSDLGVRAAADLRLLRAAVFTAVCVALSAAGHMIGSCAAVPLWTLGVGCAAVFAVAAPLAGRERSLPGIAVALAVGQLALHTVFALGQHRMATAPAAGPAPAGGGLSDQAAISLARHITCGLGAGQLDGAQARRILHTSVIGPGGPAASAGGAGHAMDPATAATAAHGLLPSLPMLLAHLLAALAAGWLLRRGEAALWRLVRLSAPAAREASAAAEALVGALRGVLALVRALCAGLLTADVRPVARFSYGDDQARPQELSLQHSVVRRGPPALALAA
ncbi:hypothetical protein OEIGOIKO_04004 [Streptomyces chrestomyceticus JCM 4735]|uniref:Integral membrane protein n=1 Tax=Streptomyces chrestomyceticus JCM 4735 TaxID=1306181 RepID=A0A7U9KVN3_9ACTN|nr:hypothetical protein [Streptomyces chrestomyceticus]GCD36244.1 hypothetical protein OEIGOIKO_04004 [Streptomyces chrestomyceticus JCM 4735]